MIKDIKSAAQKKRKGENISMPIDRKSGTRKYDRKVANKRFIWPDTMHRLFVASIFDGGLKGASPKALHAWMGEPAVREGITTEHLKSHLQKYRLNYERSKEEFLSMYDETIHTRYLQNGNNVSHRNPDIHDEQDDIERLAMNTFPIRAYSASASSKPTPSAPLQPQAQASTIELQQRLLEAYAIIEAQDHRLRMQSENHAVMQRLFAQNQEIHLEMQEQLNKEIIEYRPSLPFVGMEQTPLQPTTQLPSLLSSSMAFSPSSRASGLTGYPGPINTAGTMGTSNDSPNNSHDELHTAMQNQMNLHRQMVLRKVEVSSHIMGGNSPPQATTSPVYSNLMISPLDKSELKTVEDPSLSSIGLLDMEGWDKIGTDVELPDDDIFGFLKDNYKG